MLHIDSTGQITREHLLAMPVWPNMVYNLHARQIQGKQCISSETLVQTCQYKSTYNQVSLVLNNALRLQLGPRGWPDNRAFSWFGLNAYAALCHDHALSRSKIDVVEATTANAVECDRLKYGDPRQGNHCKRRAVTSHVKRQTSNVKRQTITTQCAAGHAEVLLRVSTHVSQFRNRKAKDGSPGIEPLLYLRAWLEAAPPDSHVIRVART